MADEDKTVYIGIELDRQAQSSFNSSVDATASRLKSAFSNVQSAIRNDTDAVDDLRKSLNEAADEAENLQKVSSAGGGGFGVEGLRRTGGALSQLGLGDIGQPIARLGDIGQVGKELGQVTDAITKMSGATEPLIAGLSAGTVALGAVAVAGGVFIGGLALIKEAYKDTGKAIEEGITRLQTYYDVLKTGSADAIQTKIKEFELNKKYTDEELAVLQTAKEKGFEAAQKAYGDLGARILSGLGATGLYGDGIKKIDDRIAELTKTSTDLTGQIEGLNDAYKSQIIQAQLATDAVLKNATDARTARANEQADAALSLDAAKAKLKAQQDLLQQDMAEYNALQASGDQSQKVKDRMAELVKEMEGVTTEITHLNDVAIPAAEHTAELADTIKKAEKATEERQKAIEEREKAEEKQRADLASAVQKADADELKIKEQSAQKKIDIENKYQNALIQAAERAVQAAQDALRRLGDEREKLTIDYNRGELDAVRKAQYGDLTAQIKGQEEQAKSYREHLDRLRDIQKQSQQQDAIDAIDRNFLAIFERKLTTRNAMEGENAGFGRSERERTIAQQQAADDATRQRAFDRQQRLIAYQQANEDARRQYEIQLRDNQIAQQRAIAQARQAKTQELSDLSVTTRQALAIRHQGLIAELQLINMGEQQKLQIQAQYYQRAISLLNSAMGNAAARSGGSSGLASNASHTALQTTQIIRQVLGVHS